MIGTSLEISRQLTAEVSGGYQDRKYDDPRLKNLRGFVGDAAVIWAPTPLTTVTLRGTCRIGRHHHRGFIGHHDAAHAARDRPCTAPQPHRHRIRRLRPHRLRGQNIREDFTDIGARLEYKLTRTFAIRASFTHERLNSTVQGSDYTANVSLVGIRVQF